MPASVRRLGPLVVLLAVLVVVSGGRGAGRPSERDDEVFLQASYLVRTLHVSPIEGVTRAAGIQYGWGGKLAQRLRSEGDIQTYALIPLWSRIGGFRTGPSPWGRSLYVESRRISLLSQAGFVASALLLLWALLPLGQGTALVASVLFAVAHPFRHGPALFDPWVMPLAVAAVGAWLRDRHRTAAALAVAATLVKPNYVFLLPAFLLASLVRPGPGDVPGQSGRRPASVYLIAGAGVAVAYAVFAAAHVIAAGQYAQGVRSGYDPAVLAYSFIETVGFRYRAGTLQLRHHWPLFPWTPLNLAALALAAWPAWAEGRLRRTAALLAGLILIPLLADFAVIGSVGAYEDGGHFRWVNVSILGTAMALPLAYREVARMARRALAPRPVEPYAERVAVPAP